VEVVNEISSKSGYFEYGFSELREYAILFESEHVGG